MPSPPFILRTYHPNDQSDILELIRLNTPAYFAETEYDDLVHYLNHELEDYFVAAVNDIVIGCGGINYIPEEQTARISWDIIHPAHHGKGIGSALLTHRIHTIQSKTDIRNIIVRTSQHAWRFYEKNGFVLQSVSPGHWAPGYDMYVMTYQET